MNNQHFAGVDPLLRRPVVSELTGLPKSTLYRLIRERTFPAPVVLSGATVAWRASEVRAWIESRQPAKAAA